ncbi:MAG: hypothetical protein ACXWV4_02660 [Flavitalea sp.]
MRNRFLFLVLGCLFMLGGMIILGSCKKGNDTPSNISVEFFDLENIVAKYQQPVVLDLTKDGRTDFSFGVLLVGDPVLQRDRYQFYVSSRVKTNLLNDANDESPMLNKGDLIALNLEGYTWYEVSAIVLTEKIVTNQSTTWNGRWTNANHKFLPIQIDKEGKLFNGWIELSFDKTEENIILHKAALSKTPGVSIRAGLQQ